MSDDDLLIRDSENIDAIRDFVAAYNARKIDAVMMFFEENPCYQDMPLDDVAGIDEMQKLIEHFWSLSDSDDWVIEKILETSGMVVSLRAGGASS